MNQSSNSSKMHMLILITLTCITFKLFCSIPVMIAIIVDILKNIALSEKSKLIAFALETKFNVDEAKRKLYSKNADFIAMNILCKDISGFDSETNELFIYSKNNHSEKINLNHKSRVASKLIDYVISCD